MCTATDVNAPAALRTLSRRSRSDQGGKQTWRPERVRNGNRCENGARSEVAERTVVAADPKSPLGEDRCRWGRNGQEHPARRRVRGPGIQGRTRRDNVGKSHLPAGTDNNLPRPADRGRTEGGRRDLVWRITPYERRGRGNALRDGAGHRPGNGNADARQRGSGHLAVPGRVRTQSRGNLFPRSRDELVSKPSWAGVYVGQRLSLANLERLTKEKPRSEPDSGDPTVRDHRGASGNVAMVEM